MKIAPGSVRPNRASSSARECHVRAGVDLEPGDHLGLPLALDLPYLKDDIAHARLGLPPYPGHEESLTRPGSGFGVGVVSDDRETVERARGANPDHAVGGGAIPGDPVVEHEVDLVGAPAERHQRGRAGGELDAGK